MVPSHPGACLKCKLACSREGGIVLRKCIGWPSYCYCWMLCLYTAETSAKAPISQHFLGGPASHLVAGWLHWTSSIVVGQQFSLTRIDSYFRYAFVFLPFNTSGGLHHVRTYKVLCLTACYSHTIISFQEIPIMAKVHQWAHAYGVHWSYHDPEPTEGCGPAGSRVASWRLKYDLSWAYWRLNSDATLKESILSYWRQNMFSFNNKYMGLFLPQPECPNLKIKWRNWEGLTFNYPPSECLLPFPLSFELLWFGSFHS